MKIFFLLIGICIYGFSYSQTKLNTKKDVEIFLLDSVISMKRYLDATKSYKYKIVNHTNNDYIIDPQGFRGKTYVHECNELYFPKKIKLKGSYSRDSFEDCKEDLLIIRKKDSLIVGLAVLNINSFYDLNPSRSYYIDIESKHNEYTATLLGCSDYIKNLKKQGYRVFEDKIEFKIPLTQ